ncbi:transporter substrate-binding domain-containing protein [Neobacillus cucumis]|uniref:transporter substrate-binding domain-containing protein n=1 Tax=Neobacillus cucumis TaxID=1740721 RepID=UPI0018DF8545|nr:transporter substrate-binding domain-containing protein [Neobacillus cucumis]MBI0581329.1 transporter substrate-binding domain-containing protein [Neobacillus cucumis]
MKRMKRSLTGIVTLVLCLTLALVGCGKADQASKQGQSGDEVLQKIKAEKTLVVGTDATFPPLEFKNDKKEFDGFDIDLMRAIGKELGADKVEFVDTEFKGLIPGLEAKKFDVVASGMYITDERKKAINFSDTYYPGGLSLLIKKDNQSINSIEDLKGKKIAVQIGTKSVQFLQENYPDIQRVEVEKNVEMFLELKSGRVDAVLTGLPAAKVYAMQDNSVKVLDKTLTNEEYGFGIRKEDSSFTQAVNKALKTLKENGKYQQISKKWFGE